MRRRAQPRIKPSISCAAQSIAWSIVLPPWVHWAIILAIVACEKIWLAMLAGAGEPDTDSMTSPRGG